MGILKNIKDALTGKNPVPVSEYGKNEFKANRAKHDQKQISKRREANKRSTQHKRK